MKIDNLVKIPATGKLDNQFVGLKIRNNQIEFHYPETYQLSENNDVLRRDILSILRTITLAKTRTRDYSSYNAEHKEKYVFPLSAYLWIISDYLTYGRYQNREKLYFRGTGGRINWKRTMRFNPIISEGNILYCDIISEKKSQKDNLLTEIYFFCVKKAVDAIGWLYGILFNPEGIDYNRLYDKKKYLGAINTELLHVFDDQKRTRLINMKNIIIGLDDSVINSKEIVYGVDSYNYVYERMIDSMFSNVKNIKDFYPHAYWNLVIEPSRVDSSNLRPDTILIKDNKVYILDAKYYRYGSTFRPGDMPETSSIQKQITYGEYVKKVKEGQYEDVFNAFLLPYSKLANPYADRFNKDMEFVGMAQASWTDDDNISSRKICAILIDTNFLVNNWVKKNEDHVANIISIIEKQVSE